MKRISILSAVVLCVSSVQGSQPMRMSWDDAYKLADKKISELSLDQKKKFMQGYSSFYFYGIPEKGIPYLYFADGPAGIHIRRNLEDTTMVRQMDKTTAFPSPVMLAATFDTDLAREYGRAIGEECRAGGIEVLLGPGVNIAKNAENGRNYEYLGEDPWLSGRLGAEYIKGMQSTGTAACMKHFIGNETEHFRHCSNSVIDERALHEVYMAPFRAGIDAGVAYIMTAYNQLNGEYTGESKFAIDTLLRRDLGFKGGVMTDWGSIYDVEKLVHSGQNMIMPDKKEEAEEIDRLIAEGRITEADVERMIRPAIATAYAFGFYDRPKYMPELLERMPEHLDVAYRTAKEGTVLLRNNGILPLAKGKKLLVVGKFIDGDPRNDGYNPTSSGDVEGYDWVSLRQAFSRRFGGDVTFAADPTDSQLADADAVMVVVGTIDLELVERPFALPAEQQSLVLRAVDNNPNTIVTVVSGSGIDMSEWNERTAAIVYAWYPGQIGMQAVAEVIAGDINPSGKMPMTIDRDYALGCSGRNVPEHMRGQLGERHYEFIPVYDINYYDSVIPGYRWYEHKGLTPLYPFGHGLSYTTFGLSKLSVKAKDGKIRIGATVANTGSRAGDEVVQLYVGEKAPTVLRAVKELKGVRRVSLEPGGNARVEFEIDRQDLAFWNDRTHGWQVNPGEYTFYVGTSASDTPLAKTVTIK